MTERLTALMHDETDTLTIPPAPAGEILTRGHRLVRRRRYGMAAGSVGLVAAAALVAATLLPGSGGGGRTERVVDPATAAYLARGAWAEGSTIHVGDATTTIDGTVKSLYYTSAGVVVRSGKVSWTDDSGPSAYGVIEPDGHVRSLDLDLGDRVPGTDATEPYLAYADGSGSSWHVHVVDVRTGQEVGDAVVSGAFTWGGWEAPPVGLSGDTVYVGLDDATPAVNWRTGEVTPTSNLLRSRMPEIAGGRTVAGDLQWGKDNTITGSINVTDVATGAVHLERKMSVWGYYLLSPDGRYAMLALEEDPSGNPLPSGFDVYDVDTGRSTHFDGHTWDYGWTPDGNLLRFGKSTLSVCDASTGACQDSPIARGDGPLRIAGNSYES
jgi:hypothetical protein